MWIKTKVFFFKNSFPTSHNFKSPLHPCVRGSRQGTGGPEACIKECKQNKGDAKTVTKRPRLSPTLQHAQTSEGDIIRSARKLNRTEKDNTLPSYQYRSDSRENFERSWRNVKKIGNGYATESYTKRQIDNRRSNRDSPSNYWDFKVRRNYICKN